MLGRYLIIGLIAFSCESIDSSLGMGYGTILTPVLLFMGYQPLEIVPLILLSEFITGILSAIMHHRKGNVNLKTGSRALKVAIILTACSILGTVGASFLAISVSKEVVQGYIAFLLMAVGLFTFISVNKTIAFSWARITGLGLLASFNKGLSGGGYGPLVSGGQVLSGLEAKNAVGITSLSEGFTCLIGVCSYLLFNSHQLDWVLGLALIGGAVLSVPVAVNVVNLLNENNLKKILSLSILTLGLFTFFQTYHQLLLIDNLPLIIVAVVISLPLAYKWGQSSDG